MANRYVKRANAELGAVYNPATRAVTGQVQDTQALYDSLIQSLQGAEQAGTQEILQSADRRGVGRASLEGQLNESLGAQTALGAAQLGAQEAGDIAGLRGSTTSLRRDRVNASVESGRTRQSLAEAKAEAKYQKKIADETYKLDIQRLNQQAEQSKRAKAYADAQAAARGGGGGSGGGLEKEASTAIEARLERLQGPDGNVSPDDYYQAKQDWMEQGGSEASFDTKFDTFVNRRHIQDYFPSQTQVFAKQLAPLYQRANKNSHGLLSKFLGR